MSVSRITLPAALGVAIFLGPTVPTAYSHGGGHGGGHGFGYGGYGHHGFGCGGYGYHGFGYGGFGYGGFGYGGFGYRGFGYGGFGYPGFGYGAFGPGGFGLGGFGYGGYGLGGLGYGYGGYGFRGYGYGGYGGFGYGGSYPSCGCLNSYPLSGGNVLYGGGYAPAGGGPLPMPYGVSAPSRYTDYYARNARLVPVPAAVSTISSSRYVDYYAHHARPAVSSVVRMTSLDRTEPASDNKARLHVTVPADAVLWLNGQRTRRTGAEREFITPALEPGRTYVYEIQARWTQEGRPREETIEVKVRANKTTTVSFDTAPLAKR